MVLILYHGRLFPDQCAYRRCCPDPPSSKDSLLSHWGEVSIQSPAVGPFKVCFSCRWLRHLKSHPFQGHPKANDRCGNKKACHLGPLRTTQKGRSSFSAPCGAGPVCPRTCFTAPFSPLFLSASFLSLLQVLLPQALL